MGLLELLGNGFGSEDDCARDTGEIGDIHPKRLLASPRRELVEECDLLLVSVDMIRPGESAKDGTSASVEEKAPEDEEGKSLTCAYSQRLDSPQIRRTRSDSGWRKVPDSQHASVSNGGQR